MNTPLVRWSLLVAAIAIAAVAFATCRRDVAPPAPPAGNTPGDATTGTHKPRRGTEPGGTGPATDGADTEPAENAPIPEDGGYPFVDVEVVKHDGSAASDATVVYALPAATTTTVEPPNANVEHGRCRLHVRRPGRYDVGAADGAFAALVQDVDVPRTGALKIVLPEPAQVALVGEPPLLPDDAAWAGADFKAEADGDNVAPFPGRGQAIRWVVPGRFQQDTRRAEFAVAKGAAGRVRFEGRDVAATPGTFTAPATLRVVPAARYPLTLRITLDPPGVSFPHPIVLRAEFLVGDVAEPTAKWAARVREHDAVGTRVPRPVLLRADANTAEGTIHWKGDGIAPGSAPFIGLVPDRPNVADVTLHLTSEPPDPDVEEVVRNPPAVNTFVLATGGDAPGAPAEVRLFVRDARGTLTAAEAAPGARTAFTVTAGTWALAARGSWASEPVLLAASQGADATALTLEPGGWLVVAPIVHPPRSLGEVSLRRRDGAPMLCQDGAQLVPSVRADRGALLGPFPEGDVEFELVIRDEVVGTARGVVRAGAREKLRIPSLAPR